MIETMKANGSTVLMEPEDMLGESVLDGYATHSATNRGLATQLREMSPDEIQSAAGQMFSDLPQQLRQHDVEQDIGRTE